MTRTNTPSADHYWGSLTQVLPSFTSEEAHTALALYHELAKGRPVEVARLGRELGVTATEAKALLDRDSLKRLLHHDDEGRIIGFGGLAVTPTHHRFDMNGRTLWTWCAWDALFMPERLGQRARVVSLDPESGRPVELVLTPHEIESVRPAAAVVSFLLPDARGFMSAADVITKFCHFVFFFTSQASAARWAIKHPGTFFYSVEEALELARRVNAKHFPAESPRRS